MDHYITHCLVASLLPIKIMSFVTQGYNTGYPYRGMEFLQPAETETTVASSKRRSLERRKARQNEKTRAEKTPATNGEAKIQSSETPPDVVTTKEVTDHKMKEAHIIDDSKTLSTVTERQEPATVIISPPSTAGTAADDPWDFLGDSPQMVAKQTTNKQVWC